MKRETEVEKDRRREGGGQRRSKERVMGGKGKGRTKGREGRRKVGAIERTDRSRESNCFS